MTVEEVNLPVPVAASSRELARREAVLSILIREAPGQRLGVSRRYFLALVEKHDLTLDQVDTMVVGLRSNLEFELKPSISKMSELLSLGATVEEIEAAYWARETIARELGGTPLQSTSSLWAIIECMREFCEGNLDGDEFGRMIIDSFETIRDSGWRTRSVRRVVELLRQEAVRLGSNQIETITEMIASSRPRRDNSWSYR